MSKRVLHQLRPVATQDAAGCTDACCHLWMQIKSMQVSNRLCVACNQQAAVQVSLVTKMLNVDPWRRYPLTLQVLSSEFEPMLAGAAPARRPSFDVAAPGSFQGIHHKKNKKTKRICVLWWFDSLSGLAGRVRCVQHCVFAECRS